MVARERREGLDERVESFGVDVGATEIQDVVPLFGLHLEIGGFHSCVHTLDQGVRSALSDQVCYARRDRQDSPIGSNDPIL